jgi:DNA polymerase V
MAEHRTATIRMSLARVQAGFPSPADDYVENAIDLDGLFDVNPTSTFFVRVEGESMLGAGIQPDDVLCVRKDRTPRDGDIVIAVIDSDFTVKRFRRRGSTIVFEAANEGFSDIVPQEGQEAFVWGVVTGLARVFQKRSV